MNTIIHCVRSWTHPTHDFVFFLCSHIYGICVIRSLTYPTNYSSWASPSCFTLSLRQLWLAALRLALSSPLLSHFFWNAPPTPSSFWKSVWCCFHTGPFLTRILVGSSSCQACSPSYVRRNNMSIFANIILATPLPDVHPPALALVLGYRIISLTLGRGISSTSSQVYFPGSKPYAPTG